ncbi:vWA domain-containing protein [Clostridium formicaceticum]|uniref:von Willebrand factor type A domain protein n=1 Tax=Clostridium formicaceticum TaxID=1497 RepID=A0AAC9RPV1_9CLOT|nr:VWA domain-containing protein [Clostridium formicaceticum]AOY75163.1 hypothetical protein BJL90_04145 [Clostridium formicaceticum]ARE89589.1 von Willebrand factor type A domain protein [Clostridium formicaceticum]
MENKEAIIKQIIVVTDGQSNAGGNPVLVAKEAFKKNIIVNTIGIIAQNQKEEKPLEEIIHIAEAGGGMHEYTYIDELYQTMQSVTYKTVNRTLQETVNKQLKEMIGQDLNDLPPESRSKILHYIDSFADEVTLQCCIVMDTSGSMANKIMMARHSILDLIDSFKTRKGKGNIALVTYPGDGGKDYRVVHDFHDAEEDLEKKLCLIQPKGVTPTAPALRYAIELMEDNHSKFHTEGVLQLEETMG